jgi:hypothetical protein
MYDVTDIKPPPERENLKIIVGSLLGAALIMLVVAFGFVHVVGWFGNRDAANYQQSVIDDFREMYHNRVTNVEANTNGAYLLLSWNITDAQGKQLSCEGIALYTPDPTLTPSERLTTQFLTDECRTATEAAAT